MQSKKIEIDEKIREVAVEQFYRYGFLNANLRDIALGCHITVGNIYRYYPSKAGLFEALLNHINNEIIHMSVIDFAYFVQSLNNDNAGGMIYRVIRDFLVTNAKLLIILIHKSEGSKFENTKAQLIEKISEALAQAHNIKDLDITRLYANLIISGMSVILTEYQDNPKMIDKYCTKVLPMMLRTVKDAVPS